MEGDVGSSGESRGLEAGEAAGVGGGRDKWEARSKSVATELPHSRASSYFRTKVKFSARRSRLHSFTSQHNLELRPRGCSRINAIMVVVVGGEGLFWSHSSPSLVRDI